MGLLINVKGLFKPYSPPTIGDLNRKRVQKTDATNEVFEQELNQATVKEGHLSSNLKIKAYQKLQKKEFTKSSKVFLVKDLMSQPVHFFHENDNPLVLQEKINKFQHNIYPVLDQTNKLIGLVRPQNIGKKTLKEILEPEFMVVYDDCPLRALIISMLAESIYHFPVIDHKRQLVGIITQTDILKFLIEKLPIEEF